MAHRVVVGDGDEVQPAFHGVRGQFGQPPDTTNPDKNYCRAPDPVTVTDGNQTAVGIYCDVP